MQKRAKNEVFGHYFDFGQLDWLVIAYDDRAIWFPLVGNTNRSWRIIQKSLKSIFWKIWSAKNEVFGHYLEFGLLDWLDVAYYDRTICFLTFGNTTRSWRIIKKSGKSIYEWAKEPKKSFLVMFSSLVCWINLILR